MIKLLSTTLVALLAAFGLSGLMPDQAAAVKEEVIICHRTNSIKNPYTKTPVDADSVDGDGGNDKGQGDHYLEHTGPIANPATMTNGDDWGDIIPPVGDIHDGLNWSTEGQAIYNADCKYPTETEFVPNTAVTAVCDVNAQVVRLTFVNSGNAASMISVNGAASTVTAGATVNVTTPITGTNVAVTVVIDGATQTVNVTCPSGGSGNVSTSSTPTTPTSPVVVRGSGGAGAAGTVASLPVTSSGTEGVAAVIAMVSTVLTGAAAYVLRIRNTSIL